MATCGGQDNSTVLEDLMQEITCSYCSKEFCHPRSLTCHHVYCTSCLEKLASEKSNTHIVCPACGKDTQLFAGGVYGLETADQKINLKKIAEKMKAKTDDLLSLCAHHSGNPCDLYCDECSQYICRDCILTGEKHDGHSCQKLEAVAKDFRQTFSKELLSLLQKQEEIQQNVEKACKRQESLQSDCKTVCDKITSSYDEIIEAIERKKREDIEQFRKNYEADFGLKELESHTKCISRLHKEMQSIQRRTQQDNSSSDILFMEHKKELLREIEQSNHYTDRIPTEPPNHKHNTTTCALTLGTGLMETIEEKVSRMNKCFDPLKCIIQASEGRVNELAYVTVKICDSDGSPCQIPQRVHVELRSLTNPSISFEAEVHAHSLSHYEAQYRPNLGSRGHCELTVRINGDIVHTQQMFVECPPVALDKPVSV